MSWQIKQWGNGKYGIWSTIVDGYETEPKKLTRDEAIAYIEHIWREDLEVKIRELREEFPIGWMDKDEGGLIITKEQS